MNKYAYRVNGLICDNMNKYEQIKLNSELFNDFYRVSFLFNQNMIDEFTRTKVRNMV